jgi:hypothetical protein
VDLEPDLPGVGVRVELDLAAVEAGQLAVFDLRVGRQARSSERRERELDAVVGPPRTPAAAPAA